MKHKQRAASAESTAPRFLADIKGFGYTPGSATAPAREFALPPSFFVIGAPRCGSTAVSDTLKANPHVSFSVPKETHYLQQERGQQSLPEWRHDYAQRYHPNLNAAHQAMGDGSVSYIFSPKP